ncbi:UDP-N-acetylmuramate dehydrogenase [Microbulbifer sp. OS29]|uniref:UDP-N-acetylenolpyruvoylglucosamine reductase n=1 Tax=Microbulbifer okhotskensis TaxID=2926617 RepID=A0A9X2ETT8_9GAMM|nr:UDP-N-acetylmuramate dehydrogenase [Microbulbifer okhotskensis]MCO1335723.1 UDP-N-acetylmuramate dehydrogenase [Microbulbifer okhotskensis]
MIETNTDLQPHNTLAISARAAFFARIQTLDELREALSFAKEKGLPILPLGGGSNIVLTGDFPGLAIQVSLRGLSLTSNGRGGYIEAAAGEGWHQLVMTAVERGIGGLENLALIPGKVGAAPIQNIGAYGVELCDCFVGLQAMEISSGELHTFSASDCEFAYRDSVFKGRLRDQYIITQVSLRLSDNWQPRVSYPALQQLIVSSQWDINDLTPEQVASAIIDIRNSKLPLPEKIPNAGSFFKNPVVAADIYHNLKSTHPDLVAYASGDGWKLAAGWLIDRAGWRGKRYEAVGVHHQQALVLVNPGRGRGDEVTRLAEAIASDVQDKFGVTLEPEPRYYP